MKLSKLFLISLAACILASCSKDDDISGPSEVDAYISIAASTGVMTKSYTKGNDEGEEDPSPLTDPGTGKEAVVKSLTAYVFDTADKWVVTKHVSMAVDENGQKFTAEGVSGEDYTVNVNGSINSIKGIHVKVARPEQTNGASASTFKVVLLANVEKLTVATLEDLQSKSIPEITTYSDLNNTSKAVGQTYLPMHNGEVLNIGGLKPSLFDNNGKETKHVLNWYVGSGSSVQEELDLSNGDEVHTGTTPKGTAVELIRSLSRIQLKSLNASFVSQYIGYIFWVESISLVNVRATSTVLGEESEESSFYGGFSDDFTIIQHLINKDETQVDNFKKKYTNLALMNNFTSETPLNFDTYINVNSPESQEGITVGSDGQQQEGAYQTRLIIKGNLKDINKNNIGTKYFHIPLKMKDVQGNVACNKFFQITATITGEGNPNPDEILENTCINFQITVQNWNVVKQEENDVN